MDAIVLTEEENEGLFYLIEEYFSATPYLSFDNFKLIEGRSISTVNLNDNMFALSPTVLTDPIYTDLKNYILEKDMCEFIVRDMHEHEIITE